MVQASINPKAIYGTPPSPPSPPPLPLSPSPTTYIVYNPHTSPLPIHHGELLGTGPAGGD